MGPHGAPIRLPKASAALNQAESGVARSLLGLDDMIRSLRSLGVLATVLSVMAFSHPALADEVRTTCPNRHLLHKGVWVLSLAYVPALIVAIESHLDADEYLYVPVVGPWLDLAHRDCPHCAHEGRNVGGLVTDGVFQGLGALSIVTSLLFRETRESSATTEPTGRRITLSLAPTPAPEGCGAALSLHF